MTMKNPSTRFLNIARYAAVAAAFLTLAAPAMAAPEIGEPAPAFAVMGSDGNTHSLRDYRGKYVVLEWLNHECPYVKKHYDTKNMQGLQAEVAGKDVVWLSIISSARGNQGYSTPEQANANTASTGAKPTQVLLDSDGTVGKLYDAKTTPHMFVVDPEGKLIYKGAIDDDPTFEKTGVASAKNYVRQGVGEALGDTAVSEPVTKPYGCSVKY
jgi:peroxiredoxin